MGKKIDPEKKLVFINLHIYIVEKKIMKILFLRVRVCVCEKKKTKMKMKFIHKVQSCFVHN